MDGSLEESVSEAVSKVQPVRSVFFRRSQLIQDGVVIDDGPTLEEIKAEEKAAKEAAADDSEEIHSDDDVDEIEEDAIVEDEIVQEVADETQESKPEDELNYESMTVSQLKDLLKEAGKPVSGKKADLIARLGVRRCHGFFVCAEIGMSDLSSVLKDLEYPQSEKLELESPWG